MTFIVATNVIASRPPERRPTGTPHAHAKTQYWNPILNSLFIKPFIEPNIEPNIETNIETNFEPKIECNIACNIVKTPTQPQLNST